MATLAPVLGPSIGAVITDICLAMAVLLMLFLVFWCVAVALVCHIDMPVIGQWRVDLIVSPEPVAWQF